MKHAMEIVKHTEKYLLFSSHFLTIILVVVTIFLLETGLFIYIMDRVDF